MRGLGYLLTDLQHFRSNLSYEMPEEDERVKIMTHTTKVRVVNSSLIFGLKT